MDLDRGASADFSRSGGRGLRALIHSSVLWAVLFAGIAFGLEHAAPERHVLIFIAACGAIVPLAGWLGHATEQLADRAGAGLGGFLNATLGNAAELIIAVIALHQGQIDIVDRIHD